MENAKEYQKQSAEADAEARKTKREFDQEIEAKHQELADVEQKINKMKEASPLDGLMAARSMEIGDAVCLEQQTS